MIHVFQIRRMALRIGHLVGPIEYDLGPGIWGVPVMYGFARRANVPPCAGVHGLAVHYFSRSRRPRRRSKYYPYYSLRVARETISRQN